jgi:hypothetical protein
MLVVIVVDTVIFRWSQQNWATYDMTTPRTFRQWHQCKWVNGRWCSLTTTGDITHFHMFTYVDGVHREDRSTLGMNVERDLRLFKLVIGMFARYHSFSVKK